MFSFLLESKEEDIERMKLDLINYQNMLGEQLDYDVGDIVCKKVFSNLVKESKSLPYHGYVLSFKDKTTTTTIACLDGCTQPFIL